MPLLRSTCLSFVTVGYANLRVGGAAMKSSPPRHNADASSFRSFNPPPVGRKTGPYAQSSEADGGLMKHDPLVIGFADYAVVFDQIPKTEKLELRTRALRKFTPDSATLPRAHYCHEAITSKRHGQKLSMPIHTNTAKRSENRFRHDP